MHLWGLVWPGQLGSLADSGGPNYYRHSWSHRHWQ
jgi:hypothetical protein